MTEFLGLVVWNVVLATALAGVVALASCVNVVRQRPPLRHALWMLVLFKLITPPLIQLPVLPNHFFESFPKLTDGLHESLMASSSSVVGSSEPDAARAEDTEPLAPAEPTGASPQSQIDVTRTPDEMAWPVLLAWLSGCGTLTLLVWNAAQTVRVSRVLRRAHSGESRWERIAAEAASHVDVGIVPQVRIVDARMTPLLWVGRRRPIIVLPRRLVDRLSDEQVSCIVRHELAHYVRRDHWANALALVVALLFWWYPVAWWARREMQVAQELCCDALALGTLPTARRCYAETLLQTLEFIQTEGSSVAVLGVKFGPGYSIKRRFEMIGHATLNKGPSWWSYLVVLAAVTMLPCLPVRARPPAKTVEKPATKPVSPGQKPVTTAEDGTGPQPVKAGSQSPQFLKRSFWRMAIKLDTPNLVPPAVQWAVFDKDPVPTFKAEVKRMRDYYRNQLEAAKDKARKQMVRSVQMNVHWNFVFKSVTGDQLYLLTSARNHSFASNNPGGKKWIVTKTVWLKKKPVCWCIPIEVKNGKETSVTLTEKNVFDLDSTFDDALRESSPTQQDKTASDRDVAK